MRLSDKDLNAFMPVMRRKKILKEINNALEAIDRIESQIKIWNIKPNNTYTTVMRDELKYLKEGKI